MRVFKHLTLTDRIRIEKWKKEGMRTREIAVTESWINSYPRRILGYKSAGTVFRECLRELGLTA